MHGSNISLAPLLLNVLAAPIIIWGCHLGAKQSYAEQESLVNQQLAQLIRDAVWLKTYLASIMRLSQEAFQLSHAALGPPQGPAQVPMPSRPPSHACPCHLVILSGISSELAYSLAVLLHGDNVLMLRRRLQL